MEPSDWWILAMNLIGQIIILTDCCLFVICVCLTDSSHVRSPQLAHWSPMILCHECRLLICFVMCVSIAAKRLRTP